LLVLCGQMSCVLIRCGRRRCSRPRASCPRSWDAAGRGGAGLLLLNLGFEHVNRVRELVLHGDGLTRERLHKDLDLSLSLRIRAAVVQEDRVALRCNLTPYAPICKNFFTIKNSLVNTHNCHELGSRRSWHHPRKQQRKVAAGLARPRRCLLWFTSETCRIQSSSISM